MYILELKRLLEQLEEFLKERGEGFGIEGDEYNSEEAFSRATVMSSASKLLSGYSNSLVGIGRLLELISDNVEGFSVEMFDEIMKLYVKRLEWEHDAAEKNLINMRNICSAIPGKYPFVDIIR